MGIVLSIVAIAILMVLMAVSLLRQRKLGVEQGQARARERAAPTEAADERLRLRRARIAAGEPTPPTTGPKTA